MKDKNVFPQDEKSFPTKMGLTKRELYAGLALQALIQKPWAASATTSHDIEGIPKMAVLLADRLIKELSK